MKVKHMEHNPPSEADIRSMDQDVDYFYGTSNYSVLYTTFGHERLFIGIQFIHLTSYIIHSR
jgi:hypothetical protein